MTLTVGIPSAGEMGAGIGSVLSGKGAHVLTLSASRSEATQRRAHDAGMQPASLEALAGSDVILSIVPPDVAIETAEHLAPHLGARAPLYIDCNAIDTRTVRAVGAIVTRAGARFVDAGIIGAPPSDDKTPAIYVSGPEAELGLELARYGLDIHVTGDEIGQASALKMCFGGLSKGMIALATAMMICAEREGIASAFREALATNQPQLLARLRKTVPPMYAKAYRWAPEMREVSQFTGDDNGHAEMFTAFARVFEQVAASQKSDASLVRFLDAFVRDDASV